MKREDTLSHNSDITDEIHTPGTSVMSYSGIANFEDAISATKFGKFNFILLLIAVPSGWAFICETTTLSYILPIAQCDLDLSLDNKGLLNAIAYIGMMSSGLLWGVLCDTLGRKKLLSIGSFLDALFVIIGSLSQSFTVLTVSKFFGGFIVNGPFAALTSYLSECHSAKYRARIQMVLGIIYSLAMIISPAVAGIILPMDISVNILNYLKIHSWNIYIFLTATPAILAGCCFIFVPESPKFLMTCGKNDQALEVFKTIYSLNTGKPRNTYPISNLVVEKERRSTGFGDKNAHKKDSTMQAFLFELIIIRSMFFPPLLKNTLLVCGLQISLVMSLNTLRLWIPQIFQVINDYEYHNNGTTAALCKMLEAFQPTNVKPSKECFVNRNNSQVYMHSIIIASIQLCGYIVAGSLINLLGKKKLLFILGILGGLCSYCLYFSNNSTITLILTSMYISSASIGLNVVLSVIVDLFPTTLRTITVQLAMLFGRFGAMGGNLAFPFVLKIGCAAAFGTLGTVMISSAFMTLLLPNTDIQPLQ